MKGKIPMIRLVGMCQDCAFYNDCPIEYLCPPMEIICDLLEGKFDEENDE